LRSLALALVLLLLLVTVGTFTSALTSTPYGAHNPDDDGIHSLIEAPSVFSWLDQREPESTWLLHGTVRGLDPQRDTLVIIAPQAAYTDREVERVDRFLEQGGRVLIADTDQAGRHLLARLDRGLEISSAPVYSTSYLEHPMRPLVEDQGVLPGMPARVELPGTHAVIGQGVAILRAHPLSWIDLDHDARPGLTEPRADHALAMRASAGQGELIVLGFPALFLNTHAEAADPDQAATRAALLDWTRDGGERRLVLHEAQRATADPLQVQALLTQEPSWLHVLVGLSGLGLVVLTAFSIQLVRVRPRRPTASHTQTDALTRRVLAELPPR
jgi:hypothetical protein